MESTTLKANEENFDSSLEGNGDALDSPEASTESTNSSKEPEYFRFEFLLLCLALFLSEASRGVVIPTLNNLVDSLGGSSFFLSFVVAMYSIGRLGSAWIYSHMADKNSMKSILLLTFFMMTVGNLTFITAERLGSRWLLVFSRAFSGFSSGILTVARAFVGFHTRENRRIQLLSYLGIVQTAGFALSPLVGGLKIHDSLGNFLFTTENFSTIILFFIDFFIFWFILIKVRYRIPEAKSVQMEPAKEEAIESIESLPALSPPQFPGVPEDLSSSIWAPPVLLYPCALVCLNGFCRGIVSIVETFGAKLYTEVRHVEDSANEAQNAGIYFGILGFFAVLVYLSMDKLTKRFGDQTILLVGLLIPSVGLFALVAFPFQDSNLFSLTVAVASIWTFGAPMSQTLAVSELAKFLKNRKQGNWMGAITAMGSFGRIILPLGAGWAYSESGEETAWAYCLVLCWLALGVYIFFIRYPIFFARLWIYLYRRWGFLCSSCRRSSSIPLAEQEENSPDSYGSGGERNSPDE